MRSIATRRVVGRSVASWLQRRSAVVASVALLTIAATLTGMPGVSAHPAHAIIANGTIQLGVWDEGHLNVPGGVPSLGGTTEVGLRFLPTGAEATAPGCLCEGWGAADAISGVTGFANESTDGVQNMTVMSFTFTATTAVSVVRIGTTLEVTHNYHPSITPNLYDVDVTIKNISAAAVDLRYRRVMDWDVEPTAFSEFSTISGTAAASAVLFSSNNGFASANPLSGPSDLGATGDFTDVGPADHGALFDFGFGSLAPGASRAFTTFYGAAGNEAGALAALAAVGSSVYSLGQPSSSDPKVGTPNTFIFAFQGVGEPDTLRPSCRLTARRPGPPVQIDVTVQDTGSGLASVLATNKQNVTVVVPPFAVGTTNPLVVTATKVNQALRSRFTLTARDVAGNVTRCTASGVISF
jgi:hypothetical protein